VTSARKIRANRANARAGPKTAAGKAESAQNAFRHGFNVPIFLDPTLASDVEALAQRIVGKRADAYVLESARRIAEAQIDLRRVRSYRHRLIERAMPDPQVQTEVAEPAAFAPAAARVGADDRGRILGAVPREAQVSALVAEFLAAQIRHPRVRPRAPRGRTPRRGRGALRRGWERRLRGHPCVRGDAALSADLELYNILRSALERPARLPGSFWVYSLMSC